MAGIPPIADVDKAKVEGGDAEQVRHRECPAEPEPPPNRPCVREERPALCGLPDLTPFERI